VKQQSKNLSMQVPKQPLSFPVRFAAILISVIAVGFLMIIAEEFNDYP